MAVASGSRNNFLFSFLTIGTIIFCDRLTKIFFTQILDLGESIPVIKNIFHFTLVYNTGIAFGLFKNQGIIFIALPVIVSSLLIYNVYLCRHDMKVDRLTVVALAMILAGAIGNLADRLMYGHVIDFIDFRVWPVFNVADSAITVGTSILLIKCIPSLAK